MPIELRKESAEGVQAPQDDSHMSFFVDENGNPSLKDSQGVVTAAAATGNPIPLNEQSVAPSPVANAVVLYSKDAGGATEFFVRDALGNEVQVTSGGSVVGGVGTFNWKNGTPGNPYVGGDTVNASFGEIIVINVEDPDVVVVNFPAITADSAGKTVQIRSLADKKKATPGEIHFTPDPADAFENHPAGTATFMIETEIRTHMCFESDGVGRWNLISFGTPLFLAEVAPPPP